MFSSEFEKEAMVKTALLKSTILAAIKRRGRTPPKSLLNAIKHMDDIPPGSYEHAKLMELLSKDPVRMAKIRAARDNREIINGLQQKLFFGGLLPYQ